MKNSGKFLIGLAVGAVAAVAAVVIILVVALALIFGGGPKKKLKKYLNFELNAKGNAKSIVDMMYPKKMLNELLDEMDMSKSEFIKELKEDQKDYKEELKEDGYKYKYKIIDCEKVDKDDIKEANEYFKEEYNLKITAAKKYTVKITEYEDGKKEDSWESTYVAYKISGKWYVGGGMF